MSHDGENDPDIVALVGCSAGAHHLGHPLLRPGGRRARRLYRRPVRAQPDRPAAQALPARPRGRRHRRGRADGGIRGAGAERGHHARRRRIRPQALPAGDRGHHRPRRGRREGALDVVRGRTLPRPPSRPASPRSAPRRWPRPTRRRRSSPARAR
jgi:hypothetical protein